MLKKLLFMVLCSAVISLVCAQAPITTSRTAAHRAFKNAYAAVAVPEAFNLDDNGRVFTGGSAKISYTELNSPYKEISAQAVAAQKGEKGQKSVDILHQEYTNLNGKAILLSESTQESNQTWSYSLFIGNNRTTVLVSANCPISNSEAEKARLRAIIQSTFISDLPEQVTASYGLTSGITPFKLIDNVGEKATFTTDDKLTLVVEKISGAEDGPLRKEYASKKWKELFGGGKSKNSFQVAKILNSPAYIATEKHPKKGIVVGYLAVVFLEQTNTIYVIQGTSSSIGDDKNLAAIEKVFSTTADFITEK
jgi:hypothetical protein